MVWILFQNWSGKGPDWELRSGFSLEIGPEKVRICFKKWSGIGPILENIGPIQDLGALERQETGLFPLGSIPCTCA